MKKSDIRLWFCLAAAAFGLVANATGVRMAHEVRLKGGWNIFYLPVTPDESADEFFADWPTDLVGCYDQAGYLRTEQFVTTAEDSALGAIVPRMQLWVRGEPGRSSLSAVIGNAVYLVNITNRTGFVKTVFGEPVAMRAVWHVSDGGDTPLNYIGITTDGMATTMTSDAYLLGLNTGWTACYTLSGRTDREKPGLTPLGFGAMVENGAAVAMDATKASEWSGPLRVSPVNGISLGTNVTAGAIMVRNDSGTNRTVKVAFTGSVRTNRSEPLPLPALIYLDPAKHLDWQAGNLSNEPYVRELKAGETLTLRLALNRAVSSGLSRDAECGGIVVVTDISAENCSHFQTAVPFSARNRPVAAMEGNQMAGLWLANITLDKVQRILPKDEPIERMVITDYYDEWYEDITNELGEVVSSNLVTEAYSVTNMVKSWVTDPLPAGAAMNLRLLLHVSDTGAMNLLQRARVGERRVTAAALPADNPVLPGVGVFAKQATFDWTVAETSRVNPFRHAKHPDHDGLRADFKTPAPSGDDFGNYVSTVKPELFSVSNTVELTWGECAWTPDEVLSGECAWTLSGLRRENAVRSTGNFTMKRISTKNLNETKEELK